jgi:hypothetical protein
MGCTNCSTLITTRLLRTCMTEIHKELLLCKYLYIRLISELDDREQQIAIHSFCGCNNIKLLPVEDIKTTQSNNVVYIICKDQSDMLSSMVRAIFRFRTDCRNM